MPKIVIPLDCSGHSVRALPVGERLARQLHAELILTTVIGPGPGDPQAEISAARQELEAISGGLACSARYRIEQGNVVREILKVIEEEAPDLVVMSSHGSTGLLELPLGSVTRDVLKACNVPVTIVGRAVEGEAIAGLVP